MSAPAKALPPRHARRTADDAHGLFGCELRILAATDAGTSDAGVARDLGVSPGYVRKVRSMYSGSWSMNDQFDAMSRRGSIALAERIEELGGRWL